MTLGGASSERGVSSYIYEPLGRSDSTKRWRGRTASGAVNDPLRRAGSRAAHEPVTRAMLLQSYTALDAFRRDYGSRELFTTLGRQLLFAETLCHVGDRSDEIADIHDSLAAMVHIEASQKEDGVWLMGDVEHASLCRALEVFGRQLSVASLDSIAKAQRRMVECLLKAERASALAEAST